MRLLGEIVSALRTENSWTLQELAAHVRRQGAPNVKHQHLQQLESTPRMRPRYVIELAAAFGKSVEELLDWEPGMPAYGPNDRLAARVRDSNHPPPYNVFDNLPDDEKALLMDYRACNRDVQTAVRALLHASRRNKHAK